MGEMDLDCLMTWPTQLHGPFSDVLQGPTRRQGSTRPPATPGQNKLQNRSESIISQKPGARAQPKALCASFPVLTDLRASTILACILPCSQMPEPPQSLHLLRILPCSQTLVPQVRDPRLAGTVRTEESVAVKKRFL